MGDKIYVVAKMIGTESSRVFGESVKGRTSDVARFARRSIGQKCQHSIQAHAAQLIPKPVAAEDRVAMIAKALGSDTPRPSVYIDVSERRIGQSVPDPAVETELEKLCTQLGFKVIDRRSGDKGNAQEVIVAGEGFSQFATHTTTWFP